MKTAGIQSVLCVLYVLNGPRFPTLAMVSWNLNSGSRVSGSSGENWASDRKLVAWTGSTEESRRKSVIGAF